MQFSSHQTRQHTRQSIREGFAGAQPVFCLQTALSSKQAQPAFHDLCIVLLSQRRPPGHKLVHLLSFIDMSRPAWHLNVLKPRLL